MRQAIVLTTFLTSLLGFLPGCVSDEPTRSLPPQPQQIQPTTLGVWATPPEDTNANGYLDTIPITVYVSSDRYPAPIQVPGSFIFRLLGKNNTELGRWVITESDAEAAVRRTRAGPGYFFRLNVNDVATDEVEAQAAEFLAEFIPAQGKPVTAPQTGLRFGRIRPGPMSGRS